MTVNFATQRFEADVIRKIALRAWTLGKAHGIRLGSRTDIEMDISATHANGNPLRLEELLDADDFNLLHDVLGIRDHLNHTTGKLMNCFRPRFSEPALT